MLLKNMVRPLWHIFVFVGIMLFVLLNWSCSSRGLPKVTAQEVEKLIQRDLPKGSAKSQVLTFVDSLRFDSLKIVHAEYDGQPFGDNAPEQPDDTIRKYVAATILNVERKGFAAYHIHMVFYFDRNERLIGHKVERGGSKT